MARRHRWRTVVLSMVLVLVLSGCWDRREIEALGIVSGVAIDLAENGEFEVTLQIINAAATRREGGAQQGEQATSLLSSRGKTVFAAVRNIATQSSRRVYFPHSHVLILGRDLAERGIEGVIDFFVRDAELRSNEYLIVAEGRGQDILATQVQNEPISAFAIRDILVTCRASGKVLPVRLRDFVSGLMSPSRSPVAPIIRIKDGVSRQLLAFEGTAVFRGARLVGELDEKATRGMLWATGELLGGIVDVKENDTTIVVEVIRSESSIDASIRGDRISVAITIRMNGNFAEQSMQKSVLDPSRLHRVQTECSQTILADLDAAIRQSKALQSDFLGLGTALYRQSQEVWGSVADTWFERLLDLDIEPSVQSVVSLFGRTVRPIQPMSNP